MQLTVIQEGKCYAICALAQGSRCEAKNFIDDCKREDSNGHTGLFALLDRIAEIGVPRANEHQFKKVRDNLYEMKTTKVRLFCFFDPAERKVIILTHGWKKGPTREQDQQIARAERLRDNYLAKH
jgi:hypothetical protein